MTRFARAKGSKASNERVPDEATPWHVMKEQLEESKMAKSINTPKAKSAKELLKEKEQPFYYDSVGNVNNEWAEFDTPKTEKKSKKEVKSEKSEKKSKKQIPTEEVTKKSKKQAQKEEPNVKSKESENLTEAPKSKKSKQMLTENVHSEAIQSTASIETKEESKRNGNFDDSQNDGKAKNKKKTKELNKKDQTTQETLPAGKDEEKVSEPPNKSTGKISKRHKRNQKRLSKKAAAGAATDTKQKNDSFNVTGNDWSSDISFGRPQKNSQDSRNKYEKPTNSSDNNRPSKFNNEKPVKRKAPKIRDDKEHKRRKPDPGSIKCVINGMEVEIVKYDGFPVKKEDAERLKELRQKMMMKAIPKSEIDVAMKLERRKAEKALARVRKQVCFHCRKAGHNLSDCPELGREESATGICFKCGSTEHTHFECKVTKKEEFRFASCFICREQGHIAKQCPDNPKGLYPQGGSCKICGDVTHLKKDCPDLTREKEETTLTLGKISENTLEALENDTPKTQNGENKSKNKIVKF